METTEPAAKRDATHSAQFVIFGYIPQQVSREDTDYVHGQSVRRQRVGVIRGVEQLPYPA